MGDTLMAWTLATAGSWGVATSSAPATDLAAVMALPGSWLYDTHPAAGGSQRVFVRKDQWGSLLATPNVDLINPNYGTSTGGTPVTISGEGLTGSTGVTFGGTAGTAFTVASDALIRVTTPAHATGTVAVVVANPRGNVTVSNGYTYS
jgi:hypothetical protein